MPLGTLPLSSKPLGSGPSVSTANSIQSSILTIITNLGLTLNSVVVPVVLRKGVKREAGVDAATQITVAQIEEGEKKIYHAFGNAASKEYGFEVVVVSPNNDDYLSNLSTYQLWRQTIEAQFEPPVVTASLPLLGVSAVWDVRVRPDRFLDRADMSTGRYDCQKIVLKVKATS